MTSIAARFGGSGPIMRYAAKPPSSQCHRVVVAIREIHEEAQYRGREGADKQREPRVAC